jgi:thymidine phosphorylase
MTDPEAARRRVRKSAAFPEALAAPRALVTDMDQPPAWAAGNALEV